MRNKFSNKDIEYFFNLNNDFPNQIFNNQEALALYCFEYTILEGNGVFDKILHKLIEIAHKEKAITLYFQDLSQESFFCKTLETKKGQLFALNSLLSNGELRSFYLSDKAYFVSNKHDWGCICSIDTEWIIWGVTESFDNKFQEHIAQCDDFKTYKYDNINDAIRFSYPVGTSDATFKKRLLLNYNFF